MRLIVLLMVLFLSGCAVKPAPMCIFCDMEVPGDTHTEHHLPADPVLVLPKTVK